MSVTYFKSASQPAWTVAVTTSLPVWEDDIPGQTKIKFRQAHIVAASYYTPLSLDTVYSAGPITYGVPTSSTYYLVAEENYRDGRGGMLEFDRLWSTVPTTWWDRSEYGFTYPGFPVGTYGTAREVSTITEGSTYYRVSYTPTDVGPGSYMHIALSYSRGGFVYCSIQFVQIGSVSTGSTVDFPKVLLGTGSFNSISGFIWKATGGRGLERTMKSTARVQLDYALSTVASIDQNLPIIDSFIPVDSSGYSVSYLTGSTKPTSTAYSAMIETRQEIVAESVRERWLGNIYVRRTTMVPAR